MTLRHVTREAALKRIRRYYAREGKQVRSCANGSYMVVYKRNRAEVALGLTLEDLVEKTQCLGAFEILEAEGPDSENR